MTGLKKRRRATLARANPPVPGASADYGARALRRLAWLMENAGSEQAQVAAAKELLDRASGAASPGPGADGKSGMEEVVARLRELRGGNDRHDR